MIQTKNKMTNNIKFSQDYEVIPPQKQRSYPISTIEWSLIKKKIDEIKDNANSWHTTGSILIGATVITFITSLTLIGDANKIPLIIWGSATILTAVIGGFAFYFGKEQLETQNKSKEDVIDFMNTIEERFQNSTSTTAQVTTEGTVIHSAKYGANGHFTDLTEKISGLVAKNILEFKVDNALVDGKDPIVGTKKTLEISCTINGKKKGFSGLEGDTVIIE